MIRSGVRGTIRGPSRMPDGCCSHGVPRAAPSFMFSMLHSTSPAHCCLLYTSRGCPLCCGKGEAHLETRVYSVGVSAFTARRSACFPSTGFNAANTAAKSAAIGHSVLHAMNRESGIWGPPESRSGGGGSAAIERHCSSTAVQRCQRPWAVRAVRTGEDEGAMCERA